MSALLLYHNYMKMILASASPRRKGILENFGYDIKVIPSNYDEKINGLIYSDNLVENCAYQKALDVKNKIKTDTLIISADTVVVADGVILGKPKNFDEAIEMLENLSNKTHFVATSICLIYKNIIKKASEKTFVTFRELSKDEIINYIKEKNPLDKAGSYGIQDEGFNFAIKIEGELDNVIGFPMKLFKKCLAEIKG